MINQKVNVVQIAATRKRKELQKNSGQVLEGADFYNLAKNPFYSFIYEEVKKLRGEN